MSSSDGLDAIAFEELARKAIAEIDPPPDVEAMQVTFNLIRAANRVQQDLEGSIHRPAGVTWAAFRILFTIFSVGPIAPAQLARLSSVSAASISVVLNTLERNKMIKRRRSTTDGRSVVVELTAKGRKTVTTLFSRNNARESDWAAALTASERATFTRLLRKLLTHHPTDPDASGKPLVPSRRYPPDPKKA